ADMAFLVNITRRDADAAAALRSFAGAWRDDPGAVGSDETRAPAGHRALHANHVADRNSLGDRHGEIEVGVDTLEDGVGGERRRYEDCGYAGTGRFLGVGDGIEDRDLLPGVLEELAAFAGCDARGDLRAVVERELGVPGAEFA